MIFAAGLGTRFKPWTGSHPKALALVNGKPLLQRNVEYLQAHGITDIIVNVHHFADQIEEAIQQAEGWGSNVTISDERDVVLETGGGLLKAKDFLIDNGPFVIMNVDILTNLDLSKLISFYQSRKPLVAFGVSDRKTSRNFLFDEEMQLCGWRNKTTGEEKISRQRDVYIEMAYSCVAVFDPLVFDFIKQTGKFSLTETYLDLAREHTVLGYDHSGDQLVDVGRPESVAVAEAIFR